MTAGTAERPAGAGALTPPPAAVEAAPAAAPTPAPAPVRRTALQGWRRWLVAAAQAVTLLGLLCVGFAVFVAGFSGFQEGHFQSSSLRTFQNALGNALAPTGPVADGTPVAVLDIPAIGVHDLVVVEGTTGRDLMRGPGHRRDTALPGQQGVSVLLGRRSAFGGPFAHLAALRVGDRIEVTTGQGRFTYTVNAYGSSTHPVADPGVPARIVLGTADSDWAPSGTVLVGARLDGTPAPDPGGRPAQIAADKALAGDDSALPALQLWALALLAAVGVTVLAVRLWKPAAAYLACVPVLGALLWCVYENAAALLPNLY